MTDSFKAWHQRIENRSNILQMLSDIPKLFASAYEMCSVHRDSKKLRFYVTDLYRVVLESLTELIAILLRTHGGSSECISERSVIEEAS